MGKSNQDAQKNSEKHVLELKEKLERLEDVLKNWEKDNEARQKRLLRIYNGIRALIVAVGAIWAAIEFGDWYLKKYKINELAASYARAADTGYRQTRNPQVALSIINKALDLNTTDLALRYKQLYYQCHVTLQELPKYRQPYTAKDFEKLDRLSAGLTLQKELTPENAELHLLEAQLLLRLGKNDQAMDALNRAIANGVELPYAECLLIQNLLQLRQIDKAHEKALEMLQKYPGNKYSHYSYGRVLWARQLYSEAQKSYLKALECDPAHYESLAEVIFCARRKVPRNYDMEKQYCKTALKYYPKAQLFHRLLIEAYINEGNNTLAILYLKRAEKVLPESGDIYSVKAQLYLNMRRFQQAENAVLRAFELAPESITIQSQLVSLYIACGNFPKAVLFNKIISSIASETNDPLALSNAAWRFYLLGTEYDFAEKLCRTAVSRSMKSNYFATLGSILFRKGNSRQALTEFDKAIALSGVARKPVHLVEKALILIELARAEDAKTVLLQAAKYAPNYYRLHLAWGEYYLRTGQPGKAAAAVISGKKSAVNVFEKSELLLLEAKLNAAAGKWQSAKELQKGALKNIDNSFSEIRVAYENYAKYCRMAGDQSEAENARKILRSISDASKPAGSPAEKAGQ